MELTKTQLVERICELNIEYKEKRGRLYYLSRDELIKLYERLRKKKCSI